MTIGREFPDGSKQAPWFHVAGLLTVACWGALAWRSHQSPEAGKLAWWLGAHVAGWILLAVAWRAVRRSFEPGCVLAWALAFRLCGLVAEPVLEDDHHRFLWDGRVFALTGDPYRKAPAEFFQDSSVEPRFQRVLDQINNPELPTVYGPVCQLGFALAYTIAPGQLWPWKLLLIGAELGLMVALRKKLSDAGFLLLAWCPLAVAESSFNAHPDMLGVALMVLAWRVRPPWLAGVLAAASGGAKVFGWLVAPFVLARSGWRAWAAFVVTLVVLYTPFLWNGGHAEFASLRTMATGWEFNSGLFALIDLMVGQPAARLICFIAFAILWLAVAWHWMKRMPSDPRWRSLIPPGGTIFGGFLLLSATINPWYALWLWPFVALNPTRAGVAALVMVTLSYCTGRNLGLENLDPFAHPVWVRPVEFGVILGAAVWDWIRPLKNRSKDEKTPGSG